MRIECFGCSGLRCLLPDRVFFITGVALDMTVENARRRPAFEARFARIFWELILRFPGN